MNYLNTLGLLPIDYFASYRGSELPAPPQESLSLKADTASGRMSVYTPRAHKQDRVSVSDLFVFKSQSPQAVCGLILWMVQSISSPRQGRVRRWK